MGNRYASAKHALGICDCCGFRAGLISLREVFVRGKGTGKLYCVTCWDSDHPQNFQGMRPINDPQALRNPRPDVPETPVPPYNPTFIG